MNNTTQEQLDAMTDEERAVWLGERKRATLIGERLFNGCFDAMGLIVYPCKNSEVVGYADFSDYLEWLQSADGIHAVKKKMIERGYIVGTCGHPKLDERKGAYTNCRIHKPYLHEMPYEERIKIDIHEANKNTEAEAVLAAACKALISEGV